MRFSDLMRPLLAAPMQVIEVLLNARLLACSRFAAAALAMLLVSGLLLSGVRAGDDFDVTGPIKTAAATDLPDGWHSGPLPPNTYDWGAIITKSMLSDSGYCRGFQFADFHGDHVLIEDAVGRFTKRVEAADVWAWNNSIKCPGDPAHKPSAAKNPPLPRSNPPALPKGHYETKCFGDHCQRIWVDDKPAAAAPAGCTCTAPCPCLTAQPAAKLAAKAAKPTVRGDARRPLRRGLFHSIRRVRRSCAGCG